jgi:hypothetical protein
VTIGVRNCCSLGETALEPILAGPDNGRYLTMSSSRLLSLCSDFSIVYISSRCCLAQETSVPVERPEIKVASNNADVRTLPVMVKGTQGKLTISTDNGNTEARGISGPLRIESGNGDLRVEGTVTAVNLHTRTGNIAAQINPGSHMTSAG